MIPVELPISNIQLNDIQVTKVTKSKPISYVEFAKITIAKNLAESKNLDELSIKIAYDFESKFKGAWSCTVKVEGFENEFEYSACRARYINSSQIKLKVMRLVISIWQ